MSNAILTPFQLLEINVISAQDLAQVSRKMRTYAVAWVHPDRKLSTRIDLQGNNNPTWNDKFVFRVDDQFLYGDTSAVMIEIYALHWFRDIHVGTVRVIVGNLIPQTSRPHPHERQRQLQLEMKFVALQVRRPSGRPQGILNIGVALLNSSMRSMPLYTQLSASAVGYRDLMGEEDPHNHHHNHHNKKEDDNKTADSEPQTQQFLLPWIPKPELRRTKSDSSSMVGSMAEKKMETGGGGRASSVIGGPEVKNINRNNNNRHKGRSKASSMISGDEIVKKGRKEKRGSLVGGSGVGSLAKAKYGSEVFDNPPPAAAARKTNVKTSPRHNPHDNWFSPRRMKLVITDSELGPSASEVAAAVAKNYRNRKVEETESEVMGSWSMESSMEGLQSKLQRWRRELPAVYDRGEFSSYVSSSSSSSPSKGRKAHGRRWSADDEGSSAFTCVGSICGLECSIVCGGGSSSSTKKKGRGRRRAGSLDGYSFL